MKYAGMDVYKARLRRLEPRLRTALAAACAERIVRIYEDHWVGTHAEAVAQAVDFGWLVATDAGAGVDAQRRAVLLGAVREQFDYLSEEGISILATTVGVSLRVLESIDDDVEASVLAAARAFEHELYVAKLAERLSQRPAFRYPKLAEAEELEWHEAVLKRAEGWRGPCARDMFEGLGVVPPRWWEAYQAGSDHL